ncbi:MAG: hypothetical protein Q8O30_00865 [Candidatus Omnitrophota bacterium]|nr:hypothetical protein [Candidatus Omnitrophota bacterium]
MKYFIAIVLISFFTMPIFARDFMWGRSSLFDRPPEPRLVYPINEEVSLIGDSLEFKWWHAAIGIDRYEFRLYKGYNMYNDNLLLKKILPFNVSSIKVEAKLFENNQVYAWSLIQVAGSGEKSDKSFISFRAIKK